MSKSRTASPDVLRVSEALNYVSCPRIMGVYAYAILVSSGSLVSTLNSCLSAEKRTYDWTAYSAALERDRD